MAQNLDSNPNLRFPWSVEAFTTTPVTPDPEDGDTNQGDPTPSMPPVELRAITSPPLEPRDDSWTQPSDRVRDRLAPAAEPILAAFLAKHPNIFELLPASVGPDMPSLNLQFFHMGRFYQMARFGQTYKGLSRAGRRSLAPLDANWNVIGLSRMMIDPPKLPIDETILVDREQALATAPQGSGRSQRQTRRRMVGCGVRARRGPAPPPVRLQREPRHPRRAGERHDRDD